MKRYLSGKERLAINYYKEPWKKLPRKNKCITEIRSKYLNNYLLVSTFISEAKKKLKNLLKIFKLILKFKNYQFHFKWRYPQNNSL